MGSFKWAWMLLYVNHWKIVFLTLEKLFYACCMDTKVTFELHMLRPLEYIFLWHLTRLLNYKGEWDSLGLILHFLYLYEIASTSTRAGLECRAILMIILVSLISVKLVLLIDFEDLIWINMEDELEIDLTLGRNGSVWVKCVIIRTLIMEKANDANQCCFLWHSKLH
ncbi:hypothetical protein ACJX0J_012530 [Zea mays]